MHAKMNSKTHLRNTFFDFSRRLVRALLKSLQKVLMRPQNLFPYNLEMGIKTAELFDAEFEPVEKVARGLRTFVCFLIPISKLYEEKIFLGGSY